MTKIKIEDDNINLENLRHENAMKEIEEIRRIILLSAVNKSIENRKDVIKEEQFEKDFQKKVLPKIETPIQNKEINNIYYKKAKNKIKFLKILLFPLFFIFVAGTTYSLLTLFFEGDLTSKILYSLGVAILVNIVFGIIYFLVVKFQKRNKMFIPNNPNLFPDLNEIKLCPICNSKLLKSDLVNDGTNIRQYIKCSSPNCSYNKTLEFSL